MKQKYEKPQLNASPYAQFENVFAECGKTQNGGCTVYPPGWVPDGSSYCAYQQGGGNPNQGGK